MNLIEKIQNKTVSVGNKLMRWPRNIWFIYQHKNLKNKRKIIYALTPPPRLKNVGDQAQAVAINAWLKKHFPKLPVFEVNKDECRYYLPALQFLIGAEDLIFLHSGGNLGDRGIWSESIRRSLISTFTNNQIVSLPQTIYFSDTPTGNQERENTRRIYAQHPNLTVIGRDPRSGELAAELFPKAKTECMPDFVLSMPQKPLIKPKNPPKALLCLRLDDESALTEAQRKEIGDSLPYDCTYYDTTLAEPIELKERERILEKTLDLFHSSDVVVTDRYHGLIFAVICRKPCVVLPTVDHKLSSAMYWFKEVQFVALAETLDRIPYLVEYCLSVESRETPDWNTQYFDKIPKMIAAP